MHEIAMSPPCAFTHLVLSTTRFSEIRDGAEFAMKRFGGVPSIVERVDGRLRFRFPFVARVYVALEVITDVVADVHFEEVTEFGQFAAKSRIKCHPKKKKKKDRERRKNKEVSI